MSLQIALPKDYNPSKHIVLPRTHLWDHVGIVDEFGRELTHAHIIEWTQRALGEPLMKLLAHRDRHLDDPTHPIHQDALEAFHARFRGLWRIDRYDAPIEWYAARLPSVKQRGITEQDLMADGAFIRLLTPQERADALAALARDKKSDSSEFEESDLENLFTTNGVNFLWTVANAGLGAANTGASPAAVTAAFNTAQSRVGVADGTTAAAAGDTDIQGTVGTNKVWQIVSGAPTITTNQMAFAASFGSTLANWAWQNFAVDNCGGSNAVSGAASGTRSGGTMLDHLVSAQGTKAGGQTWNPTMTLSIS